MRNAHWVLLALATASCNSYSTKLVVRDPKAVDVQLGKTVLPAGTAPAAVNVEVAMVEENPIGLHRFEATRSEAKLVRRPDGATELECWGCRGGPHIELVARDGVVAGNDVTPGFDPATGRVQLGRTLVTDAAVHYEDNGVQRSVESATSMEFVSFSTPARNVAEVRRSVVREPFIATALLASGALLVALGAKPAVQGPDPSDYPDQDTYERKKDLAQGVAIGFVALGAAAIWLGADNLLRPDEVQYRSPR